MIKLISLGSGSKGNCVLIENHRNKLLIDAGLGIRTLYRKLKQLSLTFDDIDGILITHEHDDHVRSVESLSEYLPVYSHPDTLEYLSNKYSIPLKNQMAVEENFSIGTMDVTPFRISHDAIHPYGFTVSDCDSKLAYLTDTGYISKGIMSIIKGSDTVMLESNHDKELLLRGAYPYPLKQRILSDTGHLCNEESALAVYDLVENGAVNVMLAHLSENNNLPELAYWTVVNYLKKSGIGLKDYYIKVASQREIVFLGREGI